MEPYTESTNDPPIIQNSKICIDMKAQAKAKDKKEKNIEEEQEISNPTNAAPKEHAAWDNKTVFEYGTWQGSGVNKPSCTKQGEDITCKAAQKKLINNKASEIMKIKNTINSIIYNISYFL